jgi:hypothetical protein
MLTHGRTAPRENGAGQWSPADGGRSVGHCPKGGGRGVTRALDLSYVFFLGLSGLPQSWHGVYVMRRSIRLARRPLVTMSLSSPPVGPVEGRSPASREAPRIAADGSSPHVPPGSAAARDLRSMT